jgi:hypothetical protein
VKTSPWVKDIGQAEQVMLVGSASMVEDEQTGGVL